MEEGEQILLRGRLDRALAADDMEAVRALMPIGFMEPKHKLQLAIGHNNARMCRLLLEEGGADANAGYEYRNAYRPLHLAKTPEVCRVLIEFGASPSFVPERHPAFYLTPFQHAVNFGRVAIVQLFMREFGEDPAQRTIHGRTMMQLASRYPEMKALLRALKTEGAIVRAMALPEDAPPRRSSGMAPL